MNVAHSLFVAQKYWKSCSTNLKCGTKNRNHTTHN